MAAVGLISGLAQGVGQYGNALRNRTEGAGSWNPETGKFYDPGKVERNFTLGGLFSPTDVLRNKNLKGYEKAAIALTGGAASGLFSKKYRERLEAENAKWGGKYRAIEQQIGDLPTYEASPLAQEKLAAMQDTSQELSGIGQEITDIAGERASRPEARDAQMQRENIKENSAARLQAIQESGGENTLGSIAQSGAMEQGELRNLNRKQTAYRFQAENDLMNAKINQGAMKAAGAQLVGSGLSGVISEQGKEFESGLDKHLTALNYKIGQFTGQQMESMQARGNMEQANQAFATSAANTALQYINQRSQMKNSNKSTETQK